MILEIQQPMWTDKMQAWAGAVGILSALVGFIILFIKDKNKENQIQKLSDIAANLNRMVVDSEKRYINSKKPQMQIIGGFSSGAISNNGQIGITIVNSNLITTISSYQITMHLDSDSIIINTPVFDSDGKQIITFSIPVDENPTGKQVTMEYYTEEGFTFSQHFTVTLDKDKVEVYPRPISYKKENGV